MTWIDHEFVWEAALAPGIDARNAYDYVEARAKNFLEQHRGAEFSTINLVEHLYSGENNQTDQRIFAALKALRDRGMRDWWITRQTDRTLRGKPIVLRLWRAPEPKTCPHCGGKL